jgi:hypothetical protein
MKHNTADIFVYLFVPLLNCETVNDVLSTLHCFVLQCWGLNSGSLYARQVL